MVEFYSARSHIMRPPQWTSIAPPLTIKDRFGNPVVPREWFLVPLFVIDDAVEKIKDGTISDFIYDPEQAALRPRQPPHG